MRNDRNILTLENLPNNVLWNIHRRLARRDPANSARLEAVSRTMRRTAPTNRANKVMNHRPPQNAQAIGDEEVQSLKERATLLYRVCKTYYAIPKRMRTRMTPRQTYTTIKKITLKLRAGAKTIRRDDISFVYDDYQNSNDPNYHSNEVNVTLKYQHQDRIAFDISLALGPHEDEDPLIVWISMKGWIFNLVGSMEDITHNMSWSEVYTPYRRRFMADGHGILFDPDSGKRKTRYDALIISRLLTLVQKYEGQTLQFYTESYNESFIRKVVQHLDPARVRFRQRENMRQTPRGAFAANNNSNVSNTNTN